MFGYHYHYHYHYYYYYYYYYRYYLSRIQESHKNEDSASLAICPPKFLASQQVCFHVLFEAGAAALPSTFALPHSVTAAEDRGIVCVADRENGRVQCFDLVGNLQQVIDSPQLGSTLYAVTYDKYSGICFYCFFSLLCHFSVF